MDSRFTPWPDRASEFRLSAPLRLMEDDPSAHFHARFRDDLLRFIPPSVRA